jgi:peroxiredoxin
MKKIFLLLAIAACTAATSFTVSEVLPIGSAMPKTDVNLKNTTGNDITLKEVRSDNGILVIFSCNTCPYVIKNQQRTIAICTHAQKNDIGVIVLNSNEGQRADEDSYDAMKTYAKQQNYTWPYAIDKNNELADAFGANRTPECFLFDKNLKLAYHGAIDDNPTDADNVKRSHLQEAINEIAAGKQVTVTQSKSVGCGIKRKG